LLCHLSAKRGFAAYLFSVMLFCGFAAFAARSPQARECSHPSILRLCRVGVTAALKLKESDGAAKPTPRCESGKDAKKQNVSRLQGLLIIFALLRGKSNTKGNVKDKPASTLSVTRVNCQTLLRARFI